LRHGFLYTSNGTINTFDAPGAIQTIPQSINGQDVITGIWQAQNGVGPYHGFVWSPTGGIISFDPSTDLPNSTLSTTSRVVWLVVPQAQKVQETKLRYNPRNPVSNIYNALRGGGLVPPKKKNASPKTAAPKAPKFPRATLEKALQIPYAIKDKNGGHVETELRAALSES
jgi:hypothetical protein